MIDQINEINTHDFEELVREENSFPYFVKAVYDYIFIRRTSTFGLNT